MDRESVKNNVGTILYDLYFLYAISKTEKTHGRTHMKSTATQQDI